MSNEKQFQILVCIDGSESSYSGLRYAVRMGADHTADLTLLFVRPLDQGLGSGGLQMDIARENMLNWGHELPGMRALKRGRDMLVEMGFMEDSWKEQVVHTDVRGDKLGDNSIIYTNEDGAKITLEMMVSPSVERGILDEIEIGEYDITIIGMCSEEEMGAGKIKPATTMAVVSQSPTPVLVARELEQEHGHFMCVDFTDKAIEAAVKDAKIAVRCHCPIYLYSVAETDDELPIALGVVARAKAAIEAAGMQVVSDSVEIGNPVEKILEQGRKYSLIVLADTSVKGLRRFFQTSVAYEVLQRAENSVMIVR
ncbi:MAG: universal stress protein [Robiginitomaculum sp.]|nr:universal stress protein [Robiginitomaculum sp.]